MFEIKLSADELVSTLLRLSKSEPVFILDSCGVGHLGSHLLIAGVRPVEIVEIEDSAAEPTLRLLDQKLSRDLAGIFTLSYDFGSKLQPGSPATPTPHAQGEPELFLALFDALIIHDYDSDRTSVVGTGPASEDIRSLLNDTQRERYSDDPVPLETEAKSNFTKPEYIAAVERIREFIRRGDTYQTNLTQQLRCRPSPGTTPETVYWRLRRDHPAPFSAFLRRRRSTVVSASPERFFRVDRNRKIESSPIKGTRRRGSTNEDDQRLRAELLSSEKDRAENTMIVDLVRNDLGRVCEFGTVSVEKLCEIEEHPTLLHLVSTVVGDLRPDAKFSDILHAVFPCGSITGAPKIRTMDIISQIEPAPRGLSMGAVGIFLPESWDYGDPAIDTLFDVSVAIRTMVISDGEAVFNVGGGIVIDSEPEAEFDESLLKARSLLNALGSRFSGG